MLCCVPVRDESHTYAVKTHWKWVVSNPFSTGFGGIAIAFQRMAEHSKRLTLRNVAADRPPILIEILRTDALDVIQCHGIKFGESGLEPTVIAGHDFGHADHAGLVGDAFAGAGKFDTGAFTGAVWLLLRNRLCFKAINFRVKGGF